MLAKDVTNYENIYCTSDAPLVTVFQMLLENGCDCVTVVESMAHKNPIGSVTEHDICLKTIREGLNPQRLSAARVMNGNIKTVSGDTNLEECGRLLRQSDCKRLIVVDQDGAYLGILTGDNLVFDEPKPIRRPLLETLKTCPVVSRELHLAY